ncbi:universal stress protein [Caenimonas aquaedulcis]|uniref:Universal stress protein n=1 Tax=Caenimonas aquaedulcis TaxID=2793270 RepID=A0A931H7P2_9BURK|nr:universal stress protein [Caenimonas aquaedulcis]MBG9390209.1 universal stress protein [Caenimonas aquaedulcis]
MYQRILVPIDGSSTANRALTAAIELAQQSGARLRVVYVLEASFYLGGYDMYGSYTDELIKAMRTLGDSVVADGLAIAKAAGVQADCMVFDKFGERLGDAVANAARLWNADLVVVGTHGRRGIGRVMLGSGAEQIIRMSPVPVLVIRSGGDESQDNHHNPKEPS